MSRLWLSEMSTPEPERSVASCSFAIELKSSVELLADKLVKGVLVSEPTLDDVADDSPFAAAFAAYRRARVQKTQANAQMISMWKACTATTMRRGTTYLGFQTLLLGCTDRHVGTGTHSPALATFSTSVIFGRLLVSRLESPAILP